MIKLPERLRLVEDTYSFQLVLVSYASIIYGLMN